MNSIGNELTTMKIENEKTNWWKSKTSMQPESMTTPKCYYFVRKSDK